MLQHYLFSIFNSIIDNFSKISFNRGYLISGNTKIHPYHTQFIPGYLFIWVQYLKKSWSIPNFSFHNLWCGSFFAPFKSLHVKVGIIFFFIFYLFMFIYIWYFLTLYFIFILFSRIKIALTMVGCTNKMRFRIID